MATWAEQWKRDGETLFVAPFDERGTVPIDQHVLHELLTQAGWVQADETPTQFIGAKREALNEVSRVSRDARQYSDDFETGAQQ